MDHGHVVVMGGKLWIMDGRGRAGAQLDANGPRGERHGRPRPRPTRQGAEYVSIRAVVGGGEAHNTTKKTYINYLKMTHSLLADNTSKHNTLLHTAAEQQGRKRAQTPHDSWGGHAHMPARPVLMLPKMAEGAPLLPAAGLSVHYADRLPYAIWHPCGERLLPYVGAPAPLHCNRQRMPRVRSPSRPARSK
jgi:hypothetical protein